MMTTVSLDHAGSATASPANTMRLSREEHERLRRRHARRRALTAYAFLLPNALFFISFLLIPIGFLFYLTFHNGAIITPAQFVGLENWQRAWSDELVRTTIRNTLFYCLLAIPSVFIIGMVLALCLQRIPKGSRSFRSLFYLPTLTPYAFS